MSIKSSWDNDSPMFNACLKLGGITAFYTLTAVLIASEVFTGKASLPILFGTKYMAPVSLFVMNAAFPYFYFRYKDRYRETLDMFKYKNETKDNAIVHLNMALSVLIFGLTAFAFAPPLK